MLSIIEVDRLRELVAIEIRKALEEAKHEDPSSLHQSDWVSNKSALKMLDVSPATLYRYRREGTLPYSKVGQKVFYRLSDIDELLASTSGGHHSV